LLDHLFCCKFYALLDYFSAAVRSSHINVLILDNLFSCEVLSILVSFLLLTSALNRKSG